MKKQQVLFNMLYPNAYQPYLLQKIDYIFAGVLFFVSLFIYFLTLTPSVTAGDSGELITTVYNMGASHPPGFPLYGIVGKLFTFLRFSDIGYKLNIFSAVSAACAVLFCYLTLVKLLGFNRSVVGFSPVVHIPAVAASLMFAFSKAHWSQAVIAEVYAFNAGLTSAMFFVMTLWYEEIITYRDEENLWLAPRITLLLAFVMGLSITNHQLPVWYIIAWALMLVPIIYLIISFKGAVFIKQFQERKFPLIMMLIVMIMVIVLLVISAIKPDMLFPEFGPPGYRLVFPQHVPYILTAILGGPVWLSFYIAQNSLYTASISRSQQDALHAVFWIVLAAVLAATVFFLGGAHGIIISMPLIITAVYQLIQKNDLARETSKNWVDNFLFLLTWALWLFVFALSVYLYFYFRAKAIAPLTEPKPLTWGDTQTLDILFNHMLRKQYPVGIDDYSNILGQIWAVIEYHFSQFGIINVLIGIIGIYYFFKNEPIQWTYYIIASLIFFWSIIDFINFEVNPRSLETQEVFFIQQFLIYAFFIAFGYQAILVLLQSLNKVKEE